MMLSPVATSLPVSRRTGGLEKFNALDFYARRVSRRTGGLENNYPLLLINIFVSRRTGGLEI